MTKKCKKPIIEDIRLVGLGFRMRVFIFDDENYSERLPREYAGIEDGDGDFGGGTFFGNTNMCAMAFRAFRGKIIDINTIAHECSHAADQILVTRGEALSMSNTETRAYIVGDLVAEIVKALEKHKIHITTKLYD